MKSVNLLTASMVVLALTGGLATVSAQHMDDKHQNQGQMGGTQQTQNMHENMQNMQQMQYSNMMGMNGQNMMMSMDGMLDHMGQLLNHTEAMVSSLEATEPDGLMDIFRGNDTDNHMLGMSRDMTEVMDGMQGMMGNMQTMMGDQSMMSQPGMQEQMDLMQATVGEMVSSMDELMKNMHAMQQIDPKLKTKN